MAYKYVAYTTDNRKVQGTIDVDGEALAEHTLTRAGYRLLSLKPVEQGPKVEELFPSLFTVKTKEVINFCRQLATLLESGTGILPALQLLRNQMQHKIFKRVLSDVVDEVQSGNSLAIALGKHPKVFPRILRRMMEVGDKTGEVEVSLRQVAIYLEKHAIAKKKMTKALMYPTMILVVAVVVVIILMTTALPPLTGLFDSLEVDLPLPTKLLLGLVGFTSAYKLYIFGAMAMSIVGGALYLRRPAGQRAMQTFLIKAPLIGPVLLLGEISRLTRTMALLINAWVALPEIMSLVKDTTDNPVIKSALEDVEKGLLQGEGLAGPMSRNKIFPKMMVMICRSWRSSSLTEA